MSISNRSVDLSQSTNALILLLESYEKSLNAIMAQPEAEIDDAQLEWVESGIEQIEDELDRRESPDYPVNDDTDSLEDRGLYLGSYLS